MNDQDLCDWLVDAGILTENWNRIFLREEFIVNATRPKAPSVILNDWRVAGACLERISNGMTLRYHFFAPQPPGGWWSVQLGKERFEGEGDFLPRAIIEAMYRAEMGDE